MGTSPVREKEPMTPDQINTIHGKASWRCNSCGSNSNLTWWNGLSVAVCSNNPECSKIEGEKYSAFIIEQEAQATYEAEWVGYL